jgi:hypothetical protein
MASRIYRVVKYVEEHFSPFAVSRLIMLSGVKVRLYGEHAADDPQDFHKVWRALCELTRDRAQSDQLAHLLKEP